MDPQAGLGWADVTLGSRSQQSVIWTVAVSRVWLCSRWNHCDSLLFCGLCYHGHEASLSLSSPAFLNGDR